MTSQVLLRIGTRESGLARAQSALVAAAIESLQPTVITKLVAMSSLGDRRRDSSNAAVRDKKEWIVDLERALLAGEIDIAIHSGKDVPSDVEPGTALVPVLSRADSRDVFVGRHVDATGGRLRFSELEPGATVGTASLRRKAQILRLRPDVHVVEWRGNVPTRIAKLDSADGVDGIVLAAAGIQRLQLPDIDYDFFSHDLMLPAVHQGTLVAQVREDNV
ncbi:MAG: hydroxymethylbilane synthase, partial [Bdellovibrionales bacterium]|nr:hydroxymethylbilane synthase [Bdellovibrionales bacterium]